MWTVLAIAGLIVDLTLAIPSADWSSLNTTLNGRLQTGIPFARPCFDTVGDNVRGEANAGECATIQTEYVNHDFRLEQFGSYMNTQWETCQATTDECLLDYNNATNPSAFSPPRTCAQGSVPSYFIKAGSVSDIQTVLAFVKKTKVEFVVKNTGHDYIGRSSGPGTLALWTHGFQNLTLDRHWTPTGCHGVAPIPAINIGAGVTHGMVNAFALANNVTVPGGADSTVGAAGGYLMGGGHSSVSNVFGLAVDRALEFEVVTPQGKHLIANQCQNSDLFFALRGGGGGTFGVVVRATEKAFPQATMHSVLVTFDNIPTNTQAVLKYVIDNGVTWAKQGWGGYIIPQQDNSIIFTNAIITDQQAVAQMAGLKNFTSTLVNGVFKASIQPSYPEFFAALLAHGVPVARPYIMASRVVPVANFATKQSRQTLYERLLTVVKESDLPVICAVAPYYYGIHGKEGGNTAINDAWYDSVWHVFSSKFWNFNETIDGRRTIYKNHGTAMQALRDITPASGAYQNEADVYEPNYTKSFWGSNYQKLVAIKNKYDPDHILDCWHCVGWKGASSSPKYSCYI